MEDAFVYVGLRDVRSVPEYLESIAESLRRRNLVLASGDQEFTARPAELVKVRVEAGRAEDVVSLTIKLSWNEDVPGTGEDATLRVGPPTA